MWLTLKKKDRDAMQNDLAIFLVSVLRNELQVQYLSLPLQSLYSTSSLVHLFSPHCFFTLG
jgi:hypothetical protein